MSDVIKICYDKITPLQVEQLFKRMCKLEADVQSITATLPNQPNSPDSTDAAVELRFTVGYDGAPAQNSDASFFLVDELGAVFLNRKIEVFREGENLTEGPDYTYNPTIGQITMTPVLKDGELIIVQMYPLLFWRVIELGTPPSIPTTIHNILINSTEILLINGVDELIF